jgi:hypothetical protein
MLLFQMIWEDLLLDEEMDMFGSLQENSFYSKQVMVTLIFITKLIVYSIF